MGQRPQRASLFRKAACRRCVPIGTRVRRVSSIQLAGHYQERMANAGLTHSAGLMPTSYYVAPWATPQLNSLALGRGRGAMHDGGWFTRGLLLLDPFETLAQRVHDEI